MVYIIALISIMLGAFAQYLLKVGVQQVIWYKDEGFYTLMSGHIVLWIKFIILALCFIKD